MTETGVGGAPVGRDEWIAGLEGVSEWTGTDQDGGDAWSADFDLGEEVAQAVGGGFSCVGGCGPGDAGVMLGEGAVEDVLATELTAFLGPDAGDDAGAGYRGGRLGDDSAGFAPTTTTGKFPWGRWKSLGCGRFPTGMRRVRGVRWGLVSVCAC
ncbi:hypothetical protein [Saccharopolyspora spinosa]|uniref:hypothetical protein n=1 Tax=Saccharopolyspora spinosa TaxID=60894 RepID=UPI00376EEFE0